LRPHVLLVDGEPSRGESLANELSDRYGCRLVRTAEAALTALHRERWSAVVVDYHLRGTGSGLDVLQGAHVVAPLAFRLAHGNLVSLSLVRDIETVAHPHAIADSHRTPLVPWLERELTDLFAPPPPLSKARCRGAIDTTAVAHAPVMRTFLARLREVACGDHFVYLHGEAGVDAGAVARRFARWRVEWRNSAPIATGGRTRDVKVIRIPSLRERPQDVPQLAQHHLDALCARDPRLPSRLDGSAVEALLAREWPGNLEELRDAIASAARGARGKRRLEACDLAPDPPRLERPSIRAKDDAQRDCLLRQLRISRTVSAAARIEGCTRTNYIRLMHRLGIVRPGVIGEGATETPSGDVRGSTDPFPRED
jgi:DNA-binding NtrC family response regulator